MSEKSSCVNFLSTPSVRYQMSSDVGRITSDVGKIHISSSSEIEMGKSVIKEEKKNRNGPQNTASKKSKKVRSKTKPQSGPQVQTESQQNGPQETKRVQSKTGPQVRPKRGPQIQTESGPQVRPTYHQVTEIASAAALLLCKRKYLDVRDSLKVSRFKSILKDYKLDFSFNKLKGNQRTQYIRWVAKHATSDDVTKARYYCEVSLQSVFIAYAIGAGKMKALQNAITRAIETLVSSSFILCCRRFNSCPPVHQLAVRSDFLEQQENSPPFLPPVPNPSSGLILLLCPTETAFNNLEISAKRCGLAFEHVFHKENPELITCEMFLDKKSVAIETGNSEKQALEAASEVAVEVLSQKSPVVDYHPNKYIFKHEVAVERSDPFQEDVYSDMIKDYASGDHQKYLKFSAQFTSQERNILHMIANQYGLKSQSCGSRKQRHLMIWRELTPQQILEIYLAEKNECNKQTSSNQ